MICKSIHHRKKHRTITRYNGKYYLHTVTDLALYRKAWNQEKRESMS